MRRLVVLTACLAGAAVAADTATLLVPHDTGSLEFVDPGSGLRLSQVALDTSPRRVAVSPDGRRAVVLGCATLDQARPAAVHLSLVDLEQPRELRRIDLGVQVCPGSLAWPDEQRVLLGTTQTTSLQVVDLATGQILPASKPAPLHAVPHAKDARWRALSDTAAVQQFLARCGRLEDLAVTPVAPRAVCHACTPTP